MLTSLAAYRQARDLSLVIAPELAIQNLITERCRELGLRRTELVVRCGFKNISKGIRRLGVVFPKILSQHGVGPTIIRMKYNRPDDKKNKRPEATVPHF